MFNQKKRRKGFSIIVNFICALLIIGAIQMTFDESYQNNHLGGIFILGAYVVLSLKHMMKDLWNGNKKSAGLNILFGILALGIIVWWAFKHFLSI
ncbi:hypothetical protein [Guptibacillus algicola]|uniref:hypothetical protein n=1 Tax=Guptibacillus algicola TaxID=225844 RepID=UPI001CD41172|nr:hypothetical protein [Alkalihalobacillus algicola]MCA0987358.1 hypothetical protein [Alkalihalobacillus algicola]